MDTCLEVGVVHIGTVNPREVSGWATEEELESQIQIQSHSLQLDSNVNSIHKTGRDRCTTDEVI